MVVILSKNQQNQAILSQIRLQLIGRLGDQHETQQKLLNQVILTQQNKYHVTQFW